MDAKVGAPSRIYEEFEPLCKWQREDARDTLIVHLPGFKKEQLKVQINNRGVLKISGERSLDASKMSKFYKEVIVPKNCNTNGIQAKFASNHLYIVLPKNTNVEVPQDNKPQQAGDSNVSAPVDQNTKPDANQEGQQATSPDEIGSKKEKIEPSVTPTKTKDHAEGEISGSRGKKIAKIAVNFGMLVAVLAAFVAFVVYMYKSTVVED